MTEIWIAIIGVIAAAVTGVITYLTTKKTNLAQASNTDALTSLVNLQVYRELVDAYRDDFRAYKEELDIKYQQLSDTNAGLVKDINFMKNKMMTMMALICLDFSCKLRKEATQELVDSINYTNEKI